MDAAKKQIVIVFFQYILITLFLFIIGSGNVISPLYGNINMLDEGQYGAWIMHLSTGGHLYKDTYAAYGPLYIYPVFLLAEIFTPTVFIIRVAIFVLNVLLAILIAQLILRELKIPYYLQLLCIVLLLIIPGFTLRQGLGLLSLLLVYKSNVKKALYWSAATGSTLAITFLTSSDMGIFSALISIFYLSYIAVKTNDMGVYLKKLLIILLSYFIVFFLFYLWSASEGWFYSYIHTIFSDLKIYSGIAIAIGSKFPNMFELMPHTNSIYAWIKFIFSQQMLLYWLFSFYLFIFIFFLIRIVLKKQREKDDIIILISIFGFLLSTILIGRVDHLTFTLPPVFILFVCYLNTLKFNMTQSRNNSEKIISLIFISIIFIFAIRLISIYRPHFTEILTIPKSIAENKNQIPHVGPVAISSEQSASISAIQSFVSTHMTKNETIFFFSNTPMLYLLVDKVSPSKYDLPEVANSREKRLEVLHDLITKKPKYIIYDTSSYAVDGVSNYARLPEVAVYLNNNYTTRKLGSYLIYSLKK